MVWFTNTKALPPKRNYSGIALALSVEPRLLISDQWFSAGCDFAPPGDYLAVLGTLFDYHSGGIATGLCLPRDDAKYPAVPRPAPRKDDPVQNISCVEGEKLSKAILSAYSRKTKWK